MSSELRLHLSARRPHGQDDTDPAIAAALARAAADEKFAAWAEAEKQSDASLADKLRSVQPPPGLRETILAGARVGRRSWWEWFNAKAFGSFRNSELVAIAAMVMILAVAVGSKYFLGETPKTWQAAAALEVARIESSEVALINPTADKLPLVRDWINQQTCPEPGSLPKRLAALGIVGCTKSQWKGIPMSIVCFDAGNDREVHLVTIGRRQLPEAPPENVPVYKSINGYATASWSEGEASMMLIGKLDEKELRKLMGENPAAAADSAEKPALAAF